MKKIFIQVVLCLLFTNIVFAQTKVPQAALKAFAAKFPAATQTKWDKENANEYEAEFVLNGKKMAANFSKIGEWLETETAKESGETPKEVLEAVTNAWPKSSIKNIFLIQTKAGKQYYEVQYAIKNGKTKEAKVSESGHIMK